MKKKKTFGIILGICIALVTFLSQELLGEQEKISQERPVEIAVLQVADHPALDATRNGIYDALKAAGYVEGVNLKWYSESAQANTTLAMQIAQKWAGCKYTALVGIGTIAAQSLYTATRKENTPVVFSSVTDPVDAGLVKDAASNESKKGTTGNEENENRVRGVSNFVAVDPQLAIYVQILPNLRKLGFIYNPGEANSVKLAELIKAACEKRNIEFVEVIANKTSEVGLAAESLVGKVDAIFISNDSTALAAFPAVVKVGLKNKIPVFVSDTDLIGEGALASVGPNQYEVGQQTGRILVKIIKGESLANQPLIEYSESVEFYLNLKTAAALGISVPQAVIQQAAKVIKE